MNAAAWVTVVSVVGGVVLHGGLAVFYYGRMSERVGNTLGWLSRVSQKVDDHETRISRLEGTDGIEGRG